MKIKTNTALIIIISITAAVISSLIISKFAVTVILICAAILLFTAGELLILYFIKREVLYRKQNLLVNSSIIMMAATMITAITDLSYGTYLLPGWCSVLGIIIFFSGNFIILTALIARPRHGLEEYNEKEKNNEDEFNKYGPYDTVRHPINLGGFFLILSLPLILGSSWAFLPAGITVILIIVHAATIDAYRFEEYKWYYDYTKKVPFTMFPLIW